ncbi:MAG TPA: DNA mismatch repair protein MutS [Thermoguttaceae bacterium]|nr:DNA mismatch repair protein MutS [Thermoguttaceae bacterium]
MPNAATTPMMRQYREAKQACPEAILLFRMGDFYELFHDDAKTAARVLGLALTSREKGDNPTAMAGFPHHQLDTYLGRLIAAGFRVAVCDQVEDPRQAKGLVRREVTRVVTPGTVTDEALLDPRASNYLAAVAGNPDDRTSPLGLAWVELSTGRFVAAGLAANQLPDQLARLAPAECLLAEQSPPLAESLGERMMVTRRPDWAFSHEAAQGALAKHFGTTSLEGFGFDDSSGDVQAVRAAGAILDYLVETQKGSLGHVDRLAPYRAAGTLEIDESSRRSLELTRTIRDGGREGSLLAVLDRSITPMGSRRLADWLANPLVELAPIVARHEAIQELLDNPAVADDLRRALRRVYDVERLLARVVTGRATPRDLSFLGRTLACLPEIKNRLVECQSERLAALCAQIDLCIELRERLAAALVDECPLVSREGGFIRTGFDPRLDELRELSGGGKQWIAQYQAQETQRTGIPNLKVGFNKVFGYYLEITNVHREKVPDDYHRKQTIKNAERYITPELKEYEEKVLTAEEKAKDLEYTLFVELRETAAAQRPRIQATAAALAELDVLAELADLARERNYCRPEMVEEPLLEILDGRHPVLDLTEPEGTFVPNDTVAGGPERPILLITGPNMAGKSTYIRQVALITIMAQLGSLVPARSARIGLADRVFARVGASDELARGQSTFMVEMIETARILNLATPRSLVILDEIGRGTSTYDGMSLAWAIIEHLDERLGCRTLFATHYHELTDLEQSLARVKNLNVAVREWQDHVVFLHKIVEGAADKSYGIHVARLAGVPREVIGRAKEILARLEEEHLDAEGRAKIARPMARRKQSEIQLTLFGPAEHPLLDELRELDLENTTPLDAMRRLAEWKHRLAAEKP